MIDCNSHSWLRSKRSILLSLLVLILFSIGIFIPSPLNQPRQSYAASGSVNLTLAANPSILPADGGTYAAVILEFENAASGTPYIPQTSLTVMLTSSSPQTGTVPSSVVFPAGSVYILVNFTTTTLPGSTTISAVTSGYSPASLTVATENVGGMPTVLQVYLSPDVIPPNEKMNSTVVVEATDSSGNPVTLGSPLTVTLSSSNAQIGSVPQTLEIQQGQSFGTSTFHPTYIAGSTTITASAGNFTSGSAVMNTVGPIARRLVLSAAPAVIPAYNGASATISIQLQDNISQTPALAPKPVSVILTSNNSAIATVSSPQVTIQAGNSYVTVSVSFGGYCPPTPNNAANLTASAQGYIKGSVILQCATPVVGNGDLSLVEYFAPNTLLPDNTTYHGVMVAQLQSLGSPAFANSNLTVYARSSDNATMQVSTGPQTMSVGETQVQFDVSSTFLPGVASITVQSPGVSSNTQTLLSFGGAPTSLQLQFAPATLLSDGKSYSTVTLGLMDGTGEPAQAPVNTVVQLSSTTPSVGQVQSTVIIPAGETYVRADFTTYGISGSTLITASTSNYTSTNSTLNLVTKAATSLGVSTVPATVIANGQHYQNIVVQLQDPFGDPEKTDSAVTVLLAIENSTIGNVSSHVVIPPGATFSHVLLNSSIWAGNTTITAFATGFTSGQAAVKTAWLPMAVSVIANPPNLNPNERANVTVIVHSGSILVQDASINWKSSLGVLTSMENTTNVNGTASSLFTAGATPGAAFIFMNITKSGYKPMTFTTSIRIVATEPQKTQPSGFMGIITEKIFFIPLWGLIIVAAAVPTASFVFIRRRSTVEGDDFSTEEEL